MSEKRDLHLDSLKGFLIILVVFAHMPIMFDFELSFTVWHKLWNYIQGAIPIIYYFHMPLFLAVSCIFVEEFTIGYLKKRFFLLLVPYMFWYFVEQLQTLLYHHIDFETFITHLSKVYSGNWTQIRSILWFLPTLFVSNIFCSLVLKYKNRINIYYIYLFSFVWLLFFINIKSIALIHVDGVIPFGLDVAFYLLPYLILIVYAYNNRDKFLSTRLFFLLISVLMSIFLIFKFEVIKLTSKIPYRIDLAQLSVPYTIVGYIAMLLLSLSILFIFLKIKSNVLFTMLGKYTLPIYLLHPFILARFHNLLRRAAGFNDMFRNGFFIFTYFVLSLILTIFISIIISKISAKYLKVTRVVGMCK